MLPARSSGEVRSGFSAIIAPAVRREIYGEVSTGGGSGRTYTVPVSYLRAEGGIVCSTGPAWSLWWKNLRGGSRVTTRVRGKESAATARVVTEPGACVEALGRFLGEFPGTARRYGVRLDADEGPNPRDVEAAPRGDRTVVIRIDRARE